MLAIVLAAHTDDAEVGTGGVMINLAKNGHDVLMVNMTSGNGGAKVGNATAEIIGADVTFMEFETGAVVDDSESYLKLETLLDDKKADIIFAHWPVDEHSDHRATASIAIKYVNSKQQKYLDATGAINYDEYCPQLMFYAPIIGKQAKCFSPNVYVELSEETFKTKERLMRFYTGNPMSDYAGSWYKHEIMSMEFRARESGACRHSEIDKGIWAEAFVCYPNPRGKERIHLPGER
jgi:LmbE family N-acetylglucosaminyl deacetylase